MRKNSAVRKAVPRSHSECGMGSCLAEGRQCCCASASSSSCSCSFSSCSSCSSRQPQALPLVVLEYICGGGSGGGSGCISRAALPSWPRVATQLGRVRCGGGGGGRISGAVLRASVRECGERCNVLGKMKRIKKKLTSRECKERSKVLGGQKPATNSQKLV